MIITISGNVENVVIRTASLEQISMSLMRTIGMGGTTDGKV